MSSRRIQNLIENCVHFGANQYPHFDMCDVTDLPRAELEKAPKMFPMNWRYLPTLDPQVDWYLSRDIQDILTDLKGATTIKLANV